MRKILLAYLFLLVDLEVVVNAGYFSLLLPLLASALLVQGLNEVANENERFEQCVPQILVVALVRVCLFIAVQCNVLPQEQVYVILAAMLVLGSFFTITYRILSVFHDVEQENGLFAATRFCLVGEISLCAIAVGCIWGSLRPTLDINFMIVSAVASALFLLTLYQLQVVYLRFEDAVSRM